MKRETLTKRIEELIRRVHDDPTLSWVSSLTLYGSYARGALECGDVDIVVEEELDDVTRVRWGRLPVTRALEEWKRELTAGQSGFEFRHELPVGAEDVTPLWKRGEAIEVAMARLHAIEADPAAGRFERETLPAFEGLERQVGGARLYLMPLVELGAIAVRQVELKEAVPRYEHAVRILEMQYGAGSGRRRAALATVAYLEEAGIAAHDVAVGRRRIRRPYLEVPDGRTQLQAAVAFVSFGWGPIFSVLEDELVSDRGEVWINVLKPPKKAPVRALEIRVLDKKRLADGMRALQHADREEQLAALRAKP